MIQTEIDDLREALIADLIDGSRIQTATVAAAFRAIPRHYFLPDTDPTRVYQDIAIPTKTAAGRAISSSSQPAIMALMLEQLQPQPGENILEIGAGTGFNAALLAHLVGPQGRVTAVDIEPDLIAAAATHLQAAGVTNVHLHCGDGSAGFAAHAPYDRIILSVAAADIMPAWLAQLKPHGRILLPLTWNGPQFSIALDRRGNYLHSQSVIGCGFMSMRGTEADPISYISLDGFTNTLVMTYDTVLGRDDQAAQRLARWLRGPAYEISAGLVSGTGPIFTDWRLWQMLQGVLPAVLDASMSDDVAMVPYLVGVRTEKPAQATTGIIESDGMAFLMRPPDQTPPPVYPDPAARTPFPVHIRAFGPQAAAVAARLRQQLAAWAGAGQPQAEALKVIAAPPQLPLPAPPPGATAFTIEKKWLRYQLYWPPATE